MRAGGVQRFRRRPERYLIPYLRDPQFKAAKDDLAERKAWFKALNDEARLNDAWITSTPGAKEVIIETLPTSQWPDLLWRRGYLLEELDGAERILPVAIREPMTINADGSLGIVSPGSTQATTMVVHHPGVHKTKRFTFALP